MNKLRIGILGWGSLLWDKEANREFDKWRERWQDDGPTLKIEFSKKSKSRHGALTLVIDRKHGVPTTVTWCLSKRERLADAVADLRCREGTRIGKIGHVRLDAQRVLRNSTSTRGTIVAWGRKKKLHAVVWTALKGDFEKTRKRFFLGAVLAHVKALTPEGKAKAAEYVWRALDFVQTPVRAALEQEPWFRKPDR